jgi:hypothetical protein
MYSTCRNLKGGVGAGRAGMVFGWLAPVKKATKDTGDKGDHMFIVYSSTDTGTNRYQTGVPMRYDDLRYVEIIAVTPNERDALKLCNIFRLDCQKAIMTPGKKIVYKYEKVVCVNSIDEFMVKYTERSTG